MTNRNFQNGAALAIGLILMAVATLVSVTAMHVAGTEERIAANQREVSVAFMAAETGLSQAISWLETGNNAENCWNLGETQCRNAINALGGEVAGDYAGTMWEIEVRLTPGGDTAELISRGSTATGTDRIVRVLYTRPTDPGPAPGFLVGLLSEEDVDVRGSADFRGGAHGNRNFINTGNSTLWGATISSTVGMTENLTLRDGGQVLSGQPKVEVPSVNAYINGGDGIPAAKDAPNVIKSCNLPSNGNLGGNTYFCDSNLTVGRNTALRNGTVLVNGDVTYRGAADLGAAGELSLGIFATGDITFNGSRDSHAVWWAEGNIRQNGSSSLNGAAVSGGTIRINGASEYIQNDDFGTIALPTVPGLPSNARGWRELKVIPNPS